MHSLRTHEKSRLEEHGIASFAKSWDELIDSVTKQIEKAGAVIMPAGAVKPATGENGQDTAPATGAPSLSKSEPLVTSKRLSTPRQAAASPPHGSARRELLG